MSGAGTYPTRLRRTVCTRTPHPTNGQLVETFTPGEWYWCRLEYLGSSVRDENGGERTVRDVRVSVRNNPPLSVLDEFETEDGETVEIEGISPGDDELICEGFLRDAES